jgi:hypothetical protein
MVSTQASPWDAGYQPPRMGKYSPTRYCVGVDLGQANDPTAIAVLEKTVAPPDTAMFSPVGDSPATGSSKDRWSTTSSTSSARS